MGGSHSWGRLKMGGAGGWRWGEPFMGEAEEGREGGENITSPAIHSEVWFQGG
jgi:hypothetical protein